MRRRRREDAERKVFQWKTFISYIQKGARNCSRDKPLLKSFLVHHHHDVFQNIVLKTFLSSESSFYFLTERLQYASVLSRYQIDISLGTFPQEVILSWSIVGPAYEILMGSRAVPAVHHNWPCSSGHHHSVFTEIISSLEPLCNGGVTAIIWQQFSVNGFIQSFGRSVLMVFLENAHNINMRCIEYIDFHWEK